MKSSYIAIDSNILINFAGCFFFWGGGGGGPKTKRLRYKKTCLSK